MEIAKGCPKGTRELIEGAGNGERFALRPHSDAHLKLLEVLGDLAVIRLRCRKTIGDSLRRKKTAVLRRARIASTLGVAQQALRVAHPHLHRHLHGTGLRRRGKRHRLSNWPSPLERSEFRRAAIWTQSRGGDEGRTGDREMWVG